MSELREWCAMSRGLGGWRGGGGNGVDVMA